ncbi:unnamed protein product [Cutaneotrichosporon oleaginosum]
MKFALALATLALVAANPVPSSPIQQRDNGLTYNEDGVAQFPHATPGACNPADGNCCPSGKAVCAADWTCWQAVGADHCCPPGQVCTEDVMHPIANDDVDTQLKPCVSVTRCVWKLCTSLRVCW